MGFYPTTQTLITYETASPTTPSSLMEESLFSAPFPINTTNQFMLQAFWSGTPTGVISVKGSVDGTVFDIPIYSIATGGTTGDLSFERFGTSVRWVRIEYAFSSGTGALICSGTTKVPN